MDQDIIALFDGFSTSLGSAGTEITAADIFKAAATLRNAKAPGNYGGGIHPSHAYQLSAKLTNTFANPNGRHKTKRCVRLQGSLAGVDIYQSANITRME